MNFGSVSTGRFATIAGHVPASAYRPDIDGLRAIAVLAVVFYHAGLGIRSGFVGVDIFFVISGYLIAGIIARDVTRRRFSFLDFYTRRARRILPALFVAVIAATLLGWLLLNAEEFRKFAASAIAALTGLSNVYFDHDTQYFASSAELKPLLMTWSLGVEEQFYLVFPFLVIALNRWLPKHLQAALLVVSLASLGLSIWSTAYRPTAAFYLPFSRAWELGAGALLAVRDMERGDAAGLTGPRAELAAVLGALLTLCAIFGLDPDAPFPGWRAGLPVAGTVLLIASRQSRLNRHVLSAAPLVAIGLVSYSWYLWHWPLMSFLRIVSVEPPPPVAMAGAVALSGIAAYLSWRLVEQPFRKAEADRRRSLPRYAVALAAILLIPVAIRLDHGAPWRFGPEAQTIEAEIDSMRDSPCLADYGRATPDMSARCVTPESRNQVALIGDSHAAALAPALWAESASHGYGMAQLTKSSCPALEGVTRLMPGHPGHAHECLAFNDHARDYLLHDPRVTIVVIAGYWSAPAETQGDRYVATDLGRGPDAPASLTQLQTGLTQLERDLQAAGKRVLVIGDAPYFEFDPAQRALVTAIPARGEAYRLLWGRDRLAGGMAGWPFVRQHADGSNMAVLKAVAAAPGASYADPTQRFCSAAGCRFSGLAGQLYYVDAQHLSEAGSRNAIGTLDLSLFRPRS